ncbi:hypothetical protein [Paenibacillus pinihumi]|nr:hypothetical protein [Paenibacillus pinihumi]
MVMEKEAVIAASFFVFKDVLQMDAKPQAEHAGREQLEHPVKPFYE